MTFYGESYGKPKLIESKIIKRIVNTQNMDIPHEQKIFNYLYQFILNNYQVILIVIVIIGGLYWRYNETKIKKQNQNNNYFDNYNDSEII
jgi:hypothetical protein